MRNFKAAIALLAGFFGAVGVHAQGRGGSGDWTAAGGDAQRSNWVRTDPKISVEHIKKPGFALAWKIKLNGEPSVAGTLNSYIGYRGFRSYAFVGSAAGDLTAIDTDLGRIEWQKKVAGGGVSSAGCPGGMTANVTRPTAVTIPGSGRGNPGGGRGRGGAKSGVGEPGEGAITIPPRTNPDGPPNAGRGGRGGAAVAATPGAPPVAATGRAPAAPARRQGSFLDALSKDGMFHSIYVSNGEEPQPAVEFIPANANAHDLIMVNNIAYAATSGGCGGVPNGIWALDLSSSQVTKWTTTADIAGPGITFGPDGTLYAATTDGEIVGLDPKTLEVKTTYKAPVQVFSSAPLVFQFNNKPPAVAAPPDAPDAKVVIAAATRDNQLHLVDAASFSGAAYPGAAVSALSSWEDPSGTRWILGSAKNSVVAWKVTDQGGTLGVDLGWRSGELAAPLTPIIVNGVVFTVTNSPSAVLHALDGTSGIELWNSGNTMTAAVRTSGLSASGSQIYIGTTDGMIYAFGFPIEH